MVGYIQKMVEGDAAGQQGAKGDTDGGYLKRQTAALVA